MGSFLTRLSSQNNMFFVIVRFVNLSSSGEIEISNILQLLLILPKTCKLSMGSIIEHLGMLLFFMTLNVQFWRKKEIVGLVNWNNKSDPYI